MHLPEAAMCNDPRKQDGNCTPRATFSGYAKRGTTERQRMEERIKIWTVCRIRHADPAMSLSLSHRSLRLDSTLDDGIQHKRPDSFAYKLGD